MKLRTLSFLAAALLVLSGCSRPADISKPRSFRDGGIAFDYPGNWKVTKNEALPGWRLIFLEDPGSALVILNIYGNGLDVDLDEYSASFTKNLAGALPFNLIRNPGRSGEGGQIDCKFTMRLASIDVPHTVNMTKHTFDGVNVICATQVADEDRPDVDAGFALIRRTLRTLQK